MLESTRKINEIISAYNKEKRIESKSQEFANFEMASVSAISSLEELAKVLKSEKCSSGSKKYAKESAKNMIEYAEAHMNCAKNKEELITKLEAIKKEF